ncbi:DUF6636 domain-containing protein [Mycolicibacterium holsaticum]|jgi:hypothetical protein|uniref:Uncharacterized protein n=1 Tax=Mycolicibacterium holsaticum TaxID=152142 RepID=A0A1E3R6T4_9MYCO|nr:DUF6636 domain-containing protein [Mycolicibacterium holsaticum]MDA4110354.1 hypothetical protein [Mycolicibacterium holsaticum DSM 44478 = JCM 12374]ODQ85658.1 hypothetical protein BHQ17_22540 [Mycolicibacterium holsaticum]
MTSHRRTYATIGVVAACALLAVPAPAAHADDLIGFTSPSGNIGCIMDSTQVRCDIRERDWAPPPPPPDCPLDYGQGLTLDAGASPLFVCAGDTALAGGGPLGYGQSTSAGVLRCDSAMSGMTCRDVETGQGFSISREGYRFF